MSSPPPSAAPPRGSRRVLIRRTVLGLLVMLVIAGACATLLRGPVEALGTRFVETWGALGVAAAVFVCDWSVLPLTNEPVVLLALSGGIDAATVFAVTAAASVVAGFAGYACGALLGRTSRLRERILAGGSERAAFTRRFGAVGVAIAALTPIPYALATWSAGVLRVPLAGFALACLVRVPKTAFYVWLLATVWQSGAA
jgi:membrane protein YqaA with SNARE-associated domain